MKTRSVGAAGCSLATEVIVKVVSPVSQIVLARLLAPEAFGMVTTVNMVVNFADIFSDAGFQKYLVQHDFDDGETLHRNANVAFWTNLGISVSLWALIAVFRDPLAAFVGNPSLGSPLAAACLSLPLTSFSSIQMAMFHRRLDFKSLMPVRIGSALLNFVSTLVLAFWGFGYWSLIIGTLVAGLVNAVGLTVQSDWKPRFYYSLNLLKEMFSFTSWTLLESITIWLTVWASTFIVGNVMGPTLLGLYKTPVSFVNGCFAIFTNATIPILFSALSRLQLDREDYLAYLRRFQSTVGLVLIPLSLGIFMFREPLVLLLLGDQWVESTLMFGLYGLLRGPVIIFANCSSEVYRSLGKPRVSMLVQVTYMAVMIPIMRAAATSGFDCVVYADAGTSVIFIAINQIVTYEVASASFVKSLYAIKESIAATAVMGFFCALTYGFAESSWFGIALDIVACILIYFVACMAMPRSRGLLLGVLHKSFKWSVA